MENRTFQRDNGTWAAEVNGVVCTHRHSTEKKALDCIEWETKTLARTGQSAWAREAAKGQKQFTTFAPASGNDELVSDEDAAHSHEYVPMPELMDLWHAETELAKSQPAGNLLFIGPSGSGKTDGARYLAGLVGLPFVKVDAASMTDPEAWFGTRELVVEDGVAVTKYAESTFAQMLTQPCVMLIDEATRIRDEHRNVVIPVIDHTRAVMNPLTGEVINRHPQCFIILAGNVGINFTGTNAMDPAFWNRCTVVEFDYADEASEERILRDATGVDPDTAHVLVRLATETRGKAKIDPEFSPVSTRQLLKAAALVKAGLDRDKAVKFVIFNVASSEGGSASIRQELQNMWNGVRVLRATPDQGTDPAWTCPVHGVAKDIPAGISSKTGKPYKAFRACTQYGCQYTSDRNPGPTATKNPNTTTANGTTICGDCNTPQPAGRNTFCVSCGATL